jgi:hypothetical protein
MVLEDGPDVCNSESSAEHSDHGKELRWMYAVDMLDEEPKPVLERTRIRRIVCAVVEEQEAQLQCRGLGVKRLDPAVFDKGETGQRDYLKSGRYDLFSLLGTKNLRKTCV